jgi:hypothetical protein
MANLVPIDDLPSNLVPASDLPENIGGKKETTGFWSRLLQGEKDPFLGGGQLASELPTSKAMMTANPLLALTNKLGQAGFDIGLKATGNKTAKEAIKEDIANTKKNYVAPEGVDWARAIGNIVNPMSAINPETSGLGLGGRVGANALIGGGYSALQPVDTSKGNYFDEKGSQVGSGLAFGAALPLATGALGKILNPNLIKSDAVRKLEAEGINPTIGQTLGGGWNRAEEKLQSLPIIGDMIANARGAAGQQFQEAAFNRALTPIGEKLPSGLTGREAIAHIQNTLSDKYESVLNDIGAIKPDSLFTKQMTELKQMVQAMKLPPEEEAKFMHSISGLSTKDAFTSDAFKRIESSLSSNASTLGRGNVFEQSIASAVSQAKANLQDLLRRQAGNKAGELSNVNKAWANFKVVQNASGKLGAEGGEFNPAQLLNAVKTMNKSKDKSQFSAGSALMQDLADRAKTVLGNKVPNSGTMDRAAMQALLKRGVLDIGTGAGLYALSPASLLGTAGLAGLYTQTGQKAIKSALYNRPDIARKAAAALSGYEPRIAQAYGLLNSQE